MSKFNFYGDKNLTYEDDHVIVLLATDVKNPRQTVANCKKYGVGLLLCISDSSAKPFCYVDRWAKRLTVYFVWLKKHNKFILIDVKEDGTFQYNHVTSKDKNGNTIAANKDIPATLTELVEAFPEIKKAIDSNAFVYYPLSQDELAFFKRLDACKSVLELSSMEDRLDYCCMTNKTIKEAEFFEMQYDESKRLFKEYILGRVLRDKNDRDVSENLLRFFPSLENRYWKKVQQNTRCILERQGAEFTLHEQKAIDENADEVLAKPTFRNLNLPLWLRKLVLLSYTPSQKKEDCRAYTMGKILLKNKKKFSIISSYLSVELVDFTEMVCIFARASI